MIWHLTSSLRHRHAQLADPDVLVALGVFGLTVSMLLASLGVIGIASLARLLADGRRKAALIRLSVTRLSRPSCWLFPVQINPNNQECVRV